MVELGSKWFGRFRSNPWVLELVLAVVNSLQWPRYQEKLGFSSCGHGHRENLGYSGFILPLLLRPKIKFMVWLVWSMMHGITGRKCLEVVW